MKSIECWRCILDVMKYESTYKRVILINDAHLWYWHKFMNSDIYNTSLSGCVGCSRMLGDKHMMLVNLLFKLGVKI